MNFREYYEFKRILWIQENTMNSREYYEFKRILWIQENAMNSVRSNSLLNNIKDLHQEISWKCSAFQLYNIDDLF